MIKPHEIQTAPKEEHRALLTPNDETNDQRNLFKEEIHDSHFCQQWFIGYFLDWYFSHSESDKVVQIGTVKKIMYLQKNLQWCLAAEG